MFSAGIRPVVEVSTVSDGNTPQFTTSIHESPDPEGAYDKLYAALMDDENLTVLDTVLYGVIRGLARKHGGICAYGNAKIAEHSCLSVATTKRCLKNLQGRGLIHIHTKPNPQGGMHRTITFAPLSMVYLTADQREPPGGPKAHTEPPKAQREPSSEAQREPHTITTTHKNDYSPLPHAQNQPSATGRKVMVEDESARDEPPRATTATPGRSESSVVSIENNTLQRQGLRENGTNPRALGTNPRAAHLSRLQAEQAKPYWQAGEGRRLAFFDAIWDLYPKQENRVGAMQAWERTLGERIEQTPGLDEAIWNGIHGWLVRWQEEETERQFVPSFTNWILKERWDDIASPKGVSA